MAWIRRVEIADATGALRDEFDAAIARAGRVWNIVHVMSVNPPILRANMELYKAVMHAPSPITRRQRELVATVVSATLGCHY